MTFSTRRLELILLAQRFAISHLAADTDYLLIASETLSAAIDPLEQAGHKIQRRNAE
jgi:hypothetical protein